jgi:hypothetical protein
MDIVEVSSSGTNSKVITYELNIYIHGRIDLYADSYIVEVNVLWADVLRFRIFVV